MSSFQFKQFSVSHDRCAMKVGTDGVLLGAWAEAAGKRTILDVGTGTGLIALMMAQRCPSAKIWGIDIDEDAVAQAKENRDRSPWHDRITILNCDFNYPFVMEGYQFDAIVSNPPFFKEQVHAPNQQRELARRQDALPIAALMRNAARLLAENGVLSLVLPFSQVNDTVGEAAINSLFLRRRCDVITTIGKKPKRTMLEFTDRIVPTSHSSITIYDQLHNYTPEFISLTRDFYYNM